MDPSTPKPSTDPTAQTALNLVAPKDNAGWIGRSLDARYRITEVLGEGGMGAVFVAEHLTLRKSVAIKVIRAELAGNGEVAARFAREAMATAHFEHPHVASAIDYGTLPEGGAYLVMQLVRGRSLREMLETRGRLPWPLACELLAQAADALSAARAAGIVHRDLKPENILVETRDDGSELVKILDFGIAHVAPRLDAGPMDATATPGGVVATRELTRVGTVMGTPGYMAPEQAVGDKVDHRTDLYALGVVLWECMAGKSLWDGPDITTIITRQMVEDVPRLREVLAEPRLPRALDDLVQRLCARAADARPEHAGLVRDELRQLVHRHAPHTGNALHAASDALERTWLRYLDLSKMWRALTMFALIALGLAFFAFSRGARSGEPDTAAQESGRATEPPIPESLQADATAMLKATKQTERRRAALSVLAFPEQARVPPYLLAIAKLESARACRDRKDAVAGLATLADVRSLPALRRLAASSKSGCGFFDLEDCNSCVRGDLRQAIEAVEAKTVPILTPPRSGQ